MGLNREEEKYIEQLYREMYTCLFFYAKNAQGNKTLAEEAGYLSNCVYQTGKPDA